MKRRLFLLALGLCSVPSLCGWNARHICADPPRSAPPPFVGAASCAAAACHNANFTHGNTGSEYTTWITRDPHAKAYESLFTNAARSMQKHLKRAQSAHEDARCLHCHVAPGFDANVHKQPAYFRTDGVSCESCHGPAQKWLNVHHLDDWQRLDHAQKKTLGMNDTRSLTGRAQVCTPCHVGTASADVDHDLIAAGHPRLHFEFSAFHASLPRHWPDAKDRAGRPDFEAEAWVVGQLAGEQARLELLAARAGDPAKPWPEFAEHDCLACHHDLRAPSWRQQLGYGKRKAGALPWHGHTPLMRHTLQVSKDDVALLKHLDSLQAAFDAGKPDRRRVVTEAQAAAALLRARAAAWVRTPPRDPWVDRLHRSILTDAAGAISGWDEVTRLQLAVAAMQLARRDMKLADLPVEFVNPLAKLDAPTYRGDARRFEPAALRARLKLAK